MCSITDTPQDRIEQYLQMTEIRYCMWWQWPTCYDCSGIVTQAYNSIWYRWVKLASSTLASQCKRKNFVNSKRWDILVLSTAPTHVAFISQGYKNWAVTILDYVANYRKATYRKHWNINWVIICDWSFNH